MDQMQSLTLRDDGTIEAMGIALDDVRHQVRFRADRRRGVCWHGEWDGAAHTIALQPHEYQERRFEALHDGLLFSLSYELLPEYCRITARLANKRETTFRPRRAGLRLGLDTYMDSYPAWNDTFFPTLLRCEPMHFWGYAMTPSGLLLGMASPDRIASWSLDYNEALYPRSWDTDTTNTVGYATHLGHRIYTFNLDLLHEAPLPPRHPQDCHELLPGADVTWRIYLVPLADLAAVKPALARLCHTPLLDLDRHTLAPGEESVVTVHSPDVRSLTATTPDGQSVTLQPLARSGSAQAYVYRPQQPGLHDITATTADGHVAAAKVYVRKPWTYYLDRARAEALSKPQKASTHLESWYGCFSTFLAAKHLPNPDLDIPAEQQFQRILALTYDEETAAPIADPGRICNTAAMISLLTDAYEGTRSDRYLELAARLADWLVACQTQDGAYRAYGTHHYTAVLYPAKSLLELVAAEKALAQTRPDWTERWLRHYHSACAAVDNLALLADNIETEGEQTFEDGMLSCSALQLACLALQIDDDATRRRYSGVAQALLAKHRCLEQLLVPDARLHGATIRFWEAQYDVLLDKNVVCSPHGWTSWKTYATWYLYQLTGREHLLRETMDTLGACMQLVDLDTGTLRWAFAVDPHVRAHLWRADPAAAGAGRKVEAVIGEQYLDMISGWWLAPSDRLVGAYPHMPLITRSGVLESDNQGGCCDNDVHEHFKCLEEVALTSAYVIQRAGGTVASWNCRVTQEGSTLTVHPAEAIVSAVHVNTAEPVKLVVHFANADVAADVTGLQWVRSPGASGA